MEQERDAKGTRVDAAWSAQECHTVLDGDVTEHDPVVPQQRRAELVGRVEVVLLLVRAVNHAPAADHHVAAVTDVGGAHHALAAV